MKQAIKPLTVYHETTGYCVKIARLHKNDSLHRGRDTCPSYTIAGAHICLPLDSIVKLATEARGLAYVYFRMWLAL